MFLPIGDSPNPPGTPWMTYLLIGLNVVFFFFLSVPLLSQAPNLNDPLLFEFLQAMGINQAIPDEMIRQNFTEYDLFVYRYGYRPADPGLISLFSAMFLHANIMHLFGNMLFLWIYGDNVEYRLGRIGYLVAYLLTGIASTLFFSMFVPDSNVPMIGASGAISGVLGLYFIWFKRNQVKVFVFLFPILMNVIMIPARFVLGFYLLIDNVLPFMMTSSGGGGVAHGAHIGGFLAGALAAFVLDRRAGVQSRMRQQAKRTPESAATVAAEQGLSVSQVIAGHLRSGDYQGAVRHYFLLDSRAERLSLRSDTVLALGEYLLGTAAWEEALTLFKRFVSDRPNDPEVDRAFLGAGKALFNQHHQENNAYQYFLSALDTADSPGLAEEAKSYLRRIENMDES